MLQKCALSARHTSPCVPCPVAQAHAGMAVSLSLCVLIQSWLDLDFPGFLLSPDRSRPPADSETDHIATVMFRCTVSASTHSHGTNSAVPEGSTSSTSAPLSMGFLWSPNTYLWYSLLPSFQQGTQKDSLPSAKGAESSAASSATVAQG